MNISRLTDHLAVEASTYKEFISVLQQETECLVTRDYRGLYEAVSGKETLLARISKLVDERGRLLSSAASELGVECSGEEAAAAVSGALAGAQREEFDGYRAMIGSLIDSVREVNRVNSLVIRSSLENINKTLGFFGNFMPGSVYKSTGAFGQVPLKGSRLNEGA